MVTRISGTQAIRPAAKAAVGAFYLATDENKVYQSNGVEWTEREGLSKEDIVGYLSGLDANKPPPNHALGWVYIATDTGIRYEAFRRGWFPIPDSGDSSVSEVSTAGPLLFGDETFAIAQIMGVNKFELRLSLNALRNWVGGEFGIRLNSAASAQTTLLLTAYNASEEQPYVIHFDQIILDPFTGPGQFDLQERDMSDVDVVFNDILTVINSPVLASVEDRFTPDMVGDFVICDGVPYGTKILSYNNPKEVILDRNATVTVPPSGPTPGIECTIGGKTQVTLATKSGFTDGATSGSWSRLVKVITSDKYYRVVFAPGTTGDGLYSIKMSAINNLSNLS